MTKPFYLTKRGSVWQVRFRDPRTGMILSARSSGETNKTRAEAWAQAQLGIMSKPAEGITFGEWANPFFGPSCPRSTRRASEGAPYSPHTLKNYVYFKREYIDTDTTLQSLPLSSVRRGDVLAFRDRLVQSVGQCATVQKVFDALRAIFSEAEYRELIDYNPCSKIHDLVYDRRIIRVISPDQVKALLRPENFEGFRYFQATAIAAYSGLRAAEIRALKWSDIEGQAFHVQRAFKTQAHIIGLPKNGHDRYSAIPKVLSSILGSPLVDGNWLVGLSKVRPLGYKKWHETLVSAGKKSGVSTTFHALRHSLNTMLREKGVPDELLRAHFGWSGRGIQEGYTHRELYDLSPIADAVDEIFGGK